MVSKSLGHTFRLAGILNSFFLCWNRDEVIEFERESILSGDIPDFEEAIGKVGCDGDADQDDESVSVVPISLMAMQSALSIVTHALTQNLILQNIELLEFDFSSFLPTIRDKDLEENDTHPVANTLNSSRDEPDPGIATVPVPSSSSSLLTTPQVTVLDVGKVLVSGGRVLCGSYLN